MRPAEKVQALLRHALHAPFHGAYEVAAYPRDIIDLLIFHKLHLAMAASKALASYRELRERFVDWNEVRVSSVREIQECIQEAPAALDLAIFIKDLLESIHRERHNLSLEFLAEQNLGEIRSYLKKLKGVENATIDMILLLRKQYPVLPLDQAMEAVLKRLGLSRSGDSRERRERQLYELVPPERALIFHHYILNHSREFCPPDEANLDCPRCRLRKRCQYYARASVKRQKGSPRRPRARLLRKAVAAKRVRGSWRGS
jgi:endonuclease-3